MPETTNLQSYADLVEYTVGAKQFNKDINYMCANLSAEVGEFVGAILRKDSKDAKEEAFARTLFTLLGAANEAGLTELDKIFFRKLDEMNTSHKSTTDVKLREK